MDVSAPGSSRQVYVVASVGTHPALTRCYLQVLIQEGVLCALVLLLVHPEHNLMKVLRGIAVAPFLAACGEHASYLRAASRYWNCD